MKKTYLLLFILVCGLFQACDLFTDDTDCSAVLCLGPPSLVFDIRLDMENVFSMGTFRLEDLSVTGQIAQDLELELGTSDTGGSSGNLIVSNGSWNEGTSSFELTLPDSQAIAITVEIQNSGGNGCCSGIPGLQGLQINGQTQELNDSLFEVNLITN